MNIEKKLQNFYDTAVSEATEDAQQQIQEHRQHLEKELNEHKEDKRREMEAAVKAEVENARREMNKTLSAEHLTLKRRFNQEQNQLKETLFTEVKGLVEAFIATDAYDEYLYNKIMEAKAFAGEDEIHIYLSASDASKLASLTEKTGLPLQLSDNSFMGGIRATIPEKNILIDNSFLEKFTTLRKEFSFEGGLKHE